ncbi:hypothetical protein ACERZ8_05890 [Tateyamaria armeniaca]|uniref:PH domain-containing protein n=1 Tax=Tateyamaria armeniaca TaxID=2518930 RepID=A0ABW8UQM8_9RHOB
MILVAFFVIALNVALYFGGAYIAKRLIGPRDIRTDRTMWDRLLNTLIGFWSPVGNPEEAIGNVFAVGRKTPQTIGSTQVFRATVGWRYGYIALMPLLVAFVAYLELFTEFAGQTPVHYYLMMLAFLIWGGIYIWTFRLEIDQDEMSCTTAMLVQREFDLWDLTSAKTTRDGFTLHFAGRSRISVPRFIEGHDTFKALIIERLDINAR